jgi:hypothetical protein
MIGLMGAILNCSSSGFGWRGSGFVNLRETIAQSDNKTMKIFVVNFFVKHENKLTARVRYRWRRDCSNTIELARFETYTIGCSEGLLGFCPNTKLYAWVGENRSSFYSIYDKFSEGKLVFGESILF